MPDVRRLSGLAILLIGCAGLLLGCLTVVRSDQVDPVWDPVSDYSFSSFGDTLFVLAIILFLAGAVALAVGARGAGLPVTIPGNALFGLWALGLLVVMVFPSNTSAADPTVSGEIHWFGGAVLFTCFPLACWGLAGSLAGVPRCGAAARRVRRHAVVGLVMVSAFGLAQWVPALPQGLFERSALVMEALTLIHLATLVWSIAR
jgi:Protein of unknown function (DUF998)